MAAPGQAEPRTVHGRESSTIRGKAATLTLGPAAEN
jgi:hypothetical protein